MDSWKFVNKVIGTPLNLFSKDFIPHCSNLNWLCLWWFDGIVLTCHSRIDCSTFISSLLLSYLIHSSKLSKQRRPSILSPSSHPLEAINGVLISLYFYKFSAPIFITLFQTCDIFLILLEVLSASVSISVSLCCFRIIPFRLSTFWFYITRLLPATFWPDRSQTFWIVSFDHP